MKGNRKRHLVLISVLHMPYACMKPHVHVNLHLPAHTRTLICACCTSLSPSSSETSGLLTFPVAVFCSFVVVHLCCSLQMPTVSRSASQGCHTRALQTRQGKHRRGCGCKSRVWRAKIKYGRVTLPLSFPGERKFFLAFSAPGGPSPPCMVAALPSSP